MSEAALEARLAGLQTSVENELRKFSKGEITEEEFTARKSTMESDYVKWYKDYQAKGRAPREERESARSMARKRLVAESYATLEGDLRLWSEGEITEEQFAARRSELERTHLRSFRRIKIGSAVPKNLYSVVYEFDRNLIAPAPPPALPPSTTPAADFEAHERRSDIGRIGYRSRYRAGGTPDPNNYFTRSSYDPVGPEPASLSPLTGSVFDVRAEGWRQGQAREGSFGWRAQQWFGDLLGKEERMFARVSDPFREGSRRLSERSLELSREGKPVRGLQAYLGGQALRFTGGVFDAATFAARPVAWGKTIEAMYGLAASGEYRKAVGTSIRSDPFGAFVDVAGGITGGYLGAQLSARALDLAFGAPQELTSLRGLDVSDDSARGETLTPRLKRTRITKTEAAILDDILAAEKPDTLLTITRGKYGRHPVWMDVGDDVIDDLLAGKPLETKGALVKTGIEDVFDELDVLQPSKTRFPDQPSFGKLEGKSVFGDKSPLTDEYLRNRLGFTKGRDVVDDLFKLDKVDEFREMGYGSRWELEGESIFTKPDTSFDVVGSIRKKRLEELGEIFMKASDEGPKTPLSKTFRPWWYPDKAAQKAGIAEVNKLLSAESPSRINPADAILKELLNLKWFPSLYGFLESKEY